jgi:hypothetical protein
MRVRVGCEFQYEADVPVPAVVLVRARADGEHRTVYESRWSEPGLPIREYQDAFGNPCWRLTFPSGPATLRYDAVVDVDDEPDPTVPDAPLTPVADLPDDALVFTLASRYIESDLIGDEAWSLFGGTPPSRPSAIGCTRTSDMRRAAVPRPSRPAMSSTGGSASVATSRCSPSDFAGR